MEYQFNVRDSTGQIVAETQAFQRMKDTSRGVFVFRMTAELLNPQHSQKETFAVTEYYQINSPGKYSIQMLRRIPPQIGNGMVQSNTITITVTP